MELAKGSLRTVFSFCAFRGPLILLSKATISLQFEHSDVRCPMMFPKAASNPLTYAAIKAAATERCLCGRGVGRAVSRVRSVGRRFGMFSDHDGAREHGLSERATHSCGTRVSNYVMHGYRAQSLPRQQPSRQQLPREPGQSNSLRP